MAAFKSHPLLEVSAEQIQAIRVGNGLENIDKMNEDIDAVLEWFSKESHLPNITLERRYIENIYLSRKCSLEQTKMKIDNLFTMKSLMPTYFFPRDPLGSNIKFLFQTLYYFPLPKLLPDNTRALYLRIRTKDGGLYKPIELAKLINLMNEYRLLYDYSTGNQILFDMNLCSFAHLFCWTPTFAKQFVMILKECYGSRAQTFHLFNGQSHIGQLVSIMKACLPTKQKDRIYVHDTMDDLFKSIPKTNMPKDFGGDAPSLDELSDAWLKEFTNEENRKFILETETWKSDESKRIGRKITTEMFGLEGSFRKLDVF